MDGSTVVSLVALGVSLFALGWQLSQSRWDRPIVSVVGRVYVMGVGGELEHEALQIVVTNVGERAVTILQAGWWTELPSEDGSPSGGLLVPTSDFPFRLEPHDSKTWELKQSIDTDNPIDQPFAQVVQRPTWRERRAGVGNERTVIGSLDWERSLPF